MGKDTSSPTKLSVDTTSGRITYTEQGEGPVALFVEGVLFSDELWSVRLSALSDLRRIVVVDLLTHVDPEFAPDRDLLRANAKMLGQFLNALNIDQADLIASGSAKAVVNIFAAVHPELIRSLTLTDYLPHDELEDEEKRSFIGLVAAKHLREFHEGSAEGVVCSSEVVGRTYDHSDKVSIESIDSRRSPLISTDQRHHDRERFITTIGAQHTLAVVSLLKELDKPAVLIWGEDQGYFGVEWSHSLSKTIPGTIRRVEFEAARILRQEEQSAGFIQELLGFWRKIDQEVN
jgi:pimeloyl-ACP methyl ester carboxylesterase